jgi:NADP-reducing hydrogenase subunit HndC
MLQCSSVRDLENHRQTLLKQRDSKKLCIAICSGTGCHAYASEKVVAAFEEQLKKQNMEIMVDIKRTGCHGFCEKGPIVVVYQHEICYCKVTPQDVPDIITHTIQQGKPVERLLYTDQKTGKPILLETDIPFYKNQTRLIFGNNRKIDPKSIDDYIALGGYSALVQ